MVIQVGEIYETNNFGTLEVIEYVNACKIGVRFLATGFERYTAAKEIRNGRVKDLFMPSVHGVGYMGAGTYSARTKGSITKEYSTWHGMIQRCYCPKSLEVRPTYKGCTVVKEWHNFQVFAAWFTNNYIEGCDLDKDIKVPGNKVYGPDTCMFVTHAENTITACAAAVVLYSPEGRRTEVYNLSKFARDNRLSQGALSAVKNGKANQHKGWTLHKESKVEVAHIVLRSPEGLRIEVYNVAKIARENSLDASSLYKVARGERGHHKGWTLYKE